MTSFVRVADISWERRNQLLAAGWRGRAGDGMEALYAPPSRQVVRAARRLADQQTMRVTELPKGRSFYATVTIVSPLTVSWRGGTYQAAVHHASYTPSVNDRVECHLVDSQLCVIDKTAVT